MRSLPASLALLALAACRTPSAVPTPAVDAAPSTALTDAAATATAAPDAAPGPLDHPYLACPSAVPSAVTRAADLKDGVEIRVTGASAATVDAIKTRARRVPEKASYCAIAMEPPGWLQDDCLGETRDALPLCPILARGASVTVLEVEDGVVIAMHTGRDVAKLRREVRARVDTMMAAQGAPAAPPPAAPPPAADVACTTADDCWLDADHKPIARPRKLRGKKIVPCHGPDSTWTPDCKEAKCIAVGWRC